MSCPWRPVALMTVLVAAATAAAQGPESPGWVARTPPTAGVASFDGCQPAECQPAATGIEAAFQAGATDTQLLGGSYFNVNLGPRIPAFNYVPLSIRQGVMLTSPEDHWWGRGNYECLFDMTGAIITSTYGHYFAGPSLFLRANWVDACCPVVPYIQAGTGVVYNDAYQDQSQHALGQSIEFYQHVELGLKWFVAPNLSLDVEGGIQHLSNGGLARRNYGINAVGAAVGLTYYFPRGQ
jgi:hypothetical protein